jgi:aspartokinase/homoserine dehydrogenase 1
VVRDRKVAEAIKACHQNFFGKQFIDLVVGVGGVGALRIRLPASSRCWRAGHCLRVVGIARRRWRSTGWLSLANWREQLVEARQLQLVAVKKLVEESHLSTR